MELFTFETEIILQSLWSHCCVEFVDRENYNDGWPLCQSSHKKICLNDFNIVKTAQDFEFLSSITPYNNMFPFVFEPRYFRSDPFTWHFWSFIVEVLGKLTSFRLIYWISRYEKHFLITTEPPNSGQRLSIEICPL